MKYKNILFSIIFIILIFMLTACNSDVNNIQRNNIETEDKNVSIFNSTDNDLNSYIENIFNEEQRNKEGIEISELSDEYKYANVADICHGKCINGEKIYTVGLYDEVMNSKGIILNDTGVSFITSIDYSSINLLEPTIVCVCGVVDDTGYKYYANTTTTVIIKDGEIIATGSKALKYINKETDDEIVNNFKSKCVEIKTYNKRDRTDESVSLFVDVTDYSYIKISGSIGINEDNKYYIKNDSVVYDLADGYKYNIGERRLKEGDKVTIYGIKKDNEDFIRMAYIEFE